MKTYIIESNRLVVTEVTQSVWDMDAQTAIKSLPMFGDMPEEILAKLKALVENTGENASGGDSTITP